MWFSNLCFVLAFFYFCFSTTNAQNKCRQENEKRMLKTGDRESEAIVIGGTNDTCIVAMLKKSLKFTLASQYCEENLPQGSLMLQENVATLQDMWQIIAHETSKAQWYVKHTKKDGKCTTLTAKGSDLSVEATKKCDTETAFLCQYKIQYNCAWNLMMNDNTKRENGKAIIESKVIMLQINDYGQPKDCRKVPESTEVTDDVMTCFMFEKDWSQWSDCSNDCTEIDKESPYQSRHKKLSAECRKKSPRLDAVFRFNNRTCNTHVLCSKSTESTSAEMSRSNTNFGEKSTNDSREEQLGQDGDEMTPNSTKSSPIVLIIVVIAAILVLILLVLLIVGVVLFVKSMRKEKKVTKEKKSTGATSTNLKIVKLKTDKQSTEQKNQTKLTKTSKKPRAKKK